MLNARQKAFADYYIECGNATEAAKKAGYSDKTAYSIGGENLKKPEISEYIAERMAEQQSKRIASADEVMEFFSAVMRGEKKDQFGLDASLDTRISAAKEIMKRHAAATDRNKGTLDKLDAMLEAITDAAKR
jgi:phage terminase small subunit